MSDDRGATDKRPAGYGPMLRAYLLPRWRWVGLLALLLGAGIGAQLANPQILRAFVDSATGGEPLEQLVRLAVIFLAVAVVGQLIGVAETYVAENLGQAATNELRADLTRHCLELDLGFHNSHTPGELIERVDGDVANLANFFSRFVLQIVGNAILVVGMLALLFNVTPTIGAALSACTATMLFALYRLRDAGVPRWTAARQASAEIFGFLEERLAGTEDIRSAGAVEHTLRRLAERAQRRLSAERLAVLVGASTGLSANLFLALTTVVGLALGALAFARGEITIGSVYLVFSYTQLMHRPIEQFTRQIQDLQRATASLARIRDLFATRSRLPPSGQTPLPPGALAIELADVSFAYVEGEPVLRGISLALEPGEVVGLLGRTGSGKTTLARLLARFYAPTFGSIVIGGVDLSEASIVDVRRAIGIVTQEIHLFHASLRDNLTLFDPTIKDGQIAGVLRALGLWDWCQALPGGLDTRLAPGGSGLSAGEAQLLAFARVFLRDPGVIILDEASSRLDPSTERQIERALDRLLLGRTAIIIAHRLATVERADTIVILEDGAIVEQGDRIALASDPPSRFARLRRVGLEEVLA
jgi:ABC-type multidrug transport system fused ATPase/permease subunit